MRFVANFLLLLMSLGSLSAQEVPAPAPTPPPAAPAVTAAKPAEKKERTVYVPFDDLAKTLANEGQGVFLPYREFLDMWNQLTIKENKEAVESPADAVLSSLDYTGVVSGEVSTITATLQVESFKDEGWAVLPLVGKGLSVAKAETGESTLRLSPEGYQLLLPKKKHLMPIKVVCCSYNFL